MLLAGVAHQQRPVAQGVDHARCAAGVLVHPLDGALGKVHRLAPARHMNAVGDVLERLLRVERGQVVARRDALVELAQLVERQLLPQLRLADEHNLNQLVRVGLKVGKKPYLLQHLRIQVLRLVNDQHAVLAPRRRVEQVDVQLLGQPEQVVRLGVNAEFAVDFAKQLHRAQEGVEDEGHLRVRIKLAEEVAADGRLARANLAGDHDKPGAVFNAEKQVGKGLPVLFAEIQKFGVGREIERFLAQPIECFVHGRLVVQANGKFLTT